MASGRRMAAVWLFITAAGLLALALLTSPASGYHQGSTKAVDTAIAETVTLPINNWTAYTFNLNPADTIVYDIRVTNGSAIDVYFVPPDGLANYANDSALQFRLWREVERQRNITGTFGEVTGSVSVIIDNVDIVPTGETPTGPVTVSVNLSRTSNLSNFLLGGLGLVVCGIVLLVVAVLLVFVRRRKKGAVAVPPPAPYAGAPPHPYQPPSGPPGPPPAPVIVREREVIREVVRVPCKYCGTLVDSTARTCPSCNAPLG